MLKKIIFAGAMFAAGVAHAFTPQTGTWVVDAELNGKPGRGFGLDVQNSTLVIQMYAYEKSGAPTFYLGAGTLTDHKTSISLVQYKGGRYFGSGELVGTETAKTGAVAMRFVSGSKGFITFPGESEKAISRYNFGYTNASSSLKGMWMFASLGATSNQVDVADLSEPLEPTDLGNGVLTTKDFLFGCENILRGPNAGYVVCIKLNASGTAIRAFRYTYSVNDGEGQAGATAATASDLLVVRRLTSPSGDGTGLFIKNKPAWGSVYDLARLYDALHNAALQDYTVNPRD